MLHNSSVRIASCGTIDPFFSCAYVASCALLHLHAIVVLVVVLGSTALLPQVGVAVPARCTARVTQPGRYIHTYTARC